MKNTPGTWGEAEPLAEAGKLWVGTVFVQMEPSCLGKPRDLTTFKEQYDHNLSQTYVLKEIPQTMETSGIKQECQTGDISM